MKPLLARDFDGIDCLEEPPCCPECRSSRVEVDVEHEGCDFNTATLVCRDCGEELLKVVVLGCSATQAEKIALSEWSKFA